MRHVSIPSGGRYPVLRSVAILWLVGAAISGIYGLWQALVTLAGWQSQMAVTTGMSLGARIIGAALWLAGTFFAVLFCIGIAELIKLFIDIEHNSRVTACGVSSSSTVATTPTVVPQPAGTGDGHRMSSYLEEESAESALIRGH